METRRRGLFFATVLMLGICPLMAQTITYTYSGTLGPVLSGSDPLGANGQSGVLTATIATSAVPTSTTSSSATYTLPPGAITVVIGGTTYGTTGTSTLKYIFSAKNPCKMIFTATVSVSGLNGTVVGTAQLAKRSFTSAVKTHPTKFAPTPQTLTAATVANGPGSQVKYSVPLFGSTILGLSGSATN